MVSLLIEDADVLAPSLPDMSSPPFAWFEGKIAECFKAFSVAPMYRRQQPGSAVTLNLPL